MAPPTSSERAVGSATTSSTRAVQLSVLPVLERRLDQCAAGILGGRADTQDVGDGFVDQGAVHAVGAQQEAVVQRHRMAGVVQAQLRLDAQSAGQHGRFAAVVAHVIGGQPRQAVAAQPVGAGVADMQQMREPAAQHESR